MNTNFNEMNTVKAKKELKHTAKFQSNMMPLDGWIIATRWVWDFDKEAMGYQVFLYSYLTGERSSETQIALAITNIDDYEGFESQSEAGTWTMDVDGV